MKIRFCENNFWYGTDKLAKKLSEDHKEVEVVAEICLDYCKVCELGPFVLIDGELVQANSVEELYEMIKQKIK